MDLEGARTITPPNVACEALDFAHNRIRKSFEGIAPP